MPNKFKYTGRYFKAREEKRENIKAILIIILFIALFAWSAYGQIPV